MYSCILLALAKQDIKEAALWYKSKQKDLGKRFTAQVLEKVKYIQQNPNAFALRYDEIRTANLDVFPFMLHYSVDEAAKIVIVSAVLHTSRNPDLWLER